MERVSFVAVGDVMIDVTIVGHGHDATIRLFPGGTAPNAAVWAASLGAVATVIGRIGDDLAGRAVRAALEERGVAADLTVDRQARTGSFVLLGATRFADRGANAAFDAEQLPEQLEADVVAVSPYLEPAAAHAAIDRSRAHWTAALGKPLRGANAVVLNEFEAEEGVHTLAERHRLACVTLGALGAIAVLDGVEESVSAPAVPAGAATGAGDAFAASLLVELARGASLADALEQGCRCGALAAVSPDGWPG